MVAEGTVEYTDNKQPPMEGTDGKPSEPNDGSSELVITVVGALLIVMGILLIGNSVLYYNLHTMVQVLPRNYHTLTMY